jgi:hypothetical protein
MKRWAILFIIFFLVQCGELPQAPVDISNPLDPNNPDYEPPQVTITGGPQEGDTLLFDGATFRWKGNRPGMVFLYRLDDRDWSEPTTDTLAPLDLIDEGPHTFQVKGRYVTGDESKPAERHFVMDAYRATSLILYPKLVEISNSETFNVELRIEEADSFAALSTKLHFDPSRLQVENMVVYDKPETSIFLKNGGQLIEFHNYDNSTGEITLDCGVVEGSPRNVTGSGKVAMITFRHISGNDIVISVDMDSELRDDDNQQVFIQNLILEGPAESVVRVK